MKLVMPNSKKCNEALNVEVREAIEAPDAELIQTYEKLVDREETSSLLVDMKKEPITGQNGKAVIYAEVVNIYNNSK